MRELGVMGRGELARLRILFYGLLTLGAVTRTWLASRDVDVEALTLSAVVWIALVGDAAALGPAADGVHGWPVRSARGGLARVGVVSLLGVLVWLFALALEPLAASLGSGTSGRLEIAVAPTALGAGALAAAWIGSATRRGVPAMIAGVLVAWALADPVSRVRGLRAFGAWELWGIRWVDVVVLGALCTALVVSASPRGRMRRSGARRLIVGWAGALGLAGMAVAASNFELRASWSDPRWRASASSLTVDHVVGTASVVLSRRDEGDTSWIFEWGPGAPRPRPSTPWTVVAREALAGSETWRGCETHWDLGRVGQRLRFRLPGTGTFVSLQAPFGEGTTAYGVDANAQLWALEPGADSPWMVGCYPGARSGPASSSPDGRYVAWRTEDGQVAVLDRAYGRVARTEGRVPQRTVVPYSYVLESHGDDLLLWTKAPGAEVKCWWRLRGTELETIPFEEPVESLAIVGSGEAVAVLRTGAIVRVSLEGEVLATIRP